MDVAVLLGCAAPTGMGAVYNVLKAQPGDAIAVFGTGGVGLHAVHGGSPGRRHAHHRHRSQPDTAGTRPALRRYSCRLIRLPPTCSRRSRRSCRKVWILLWKSSGVPAAMEQAVNATRQQGGRAVVIGNARHGAILSLNPSVFNQGKSLMGTWGGDSVPDRDYGRYARLLGAGRFPVARPPVQTLCARTGRPGLAGSRLRHDRPSPDRHVVGLEHADRDRFRQHHRLL